MYASNKNYNKNMQRLNSVGKRSLDDLELEKETEKLAEALGVKVLGSKTGYRFSPEVDLAFRGSDSKGKLFSVKWGAKSDAEVSIDIGHSKNGPDVPLVGYQTGAGGAVRGNILLGKYQ